MCHRADRGIQCHINNGASGYKPEVISTTICANGDREHGVCNDWDNYNSIRFLDLTGDGKADLFLRGDQGIRVYKSTGTGFEEFYASNKLRNGLDDDKTTEFDDNNKPYIYHADIDGDSYVDMCYRSDAGIKCYLNNKGNGYAPTPISTSICKDGDSNHGGCNKEENWQTIRFIDINADGKSDLFFISDSGVRVYTFNGTGFSLYHSSGLLKAGNDGAGTVFDSNNYPYIFNPDINGDGLVDLCYRSDVGIKCHLNHGKGFQSKVSLFTSICSDNDGDCDDEDNWKTIQFVDMDNDGKSDLYYRAGSGIKISLSTGTSFVAKTLPVVLQNGSGNDTYDITNDDDNVYSGGFTDLNGDGFLDFYYRSDKKGLLYYLNTSEHAEISRVTNNFDQDIDILYNPLWKVYTKKGLISRADIELTPPMQVVSKVRSLNGINTNKSNTTYHYAGYVVNRDRGSQGFASITTADSASGFITTTNYTQSFPITGRVRYTVTSASDNKFMHYSLVIYHQSTYEDNPKVHLVYPKNKGSTLKN